MQRFNWKNIFAVLIMLEGVLIIRYVTTSNYGWLAFSLVFLVVNTVFFVLHGVTKKSKETKVVYLVVSDPGIDRSIISRGW